MRTLPPPVFQLSASSGVWPPGLVTSGCSTQAARHTSVHRARPITAGRSAHEPVAVLMAGSSEADFGSPGDLLIAAQPRPPSTHAIQP